MYDLEYIRVEKTSELPGLLNKNTKILSGGTDLIPFIRKSKNEINCLVDIGNIKDLKFIRMAQDQLEIGALTTFNELILNAQTNRCPEILTVAAKKIGSPLIRNRGTIGGNIANASPAADIVLPLLALESSVVILKKNQKTLLPLNSIYKKDGGTILTHNEVILSIQLKKPNERNKTTFFKIGNRRGMSIAVVNLAVNLRLNEKQMIEYITIAAGSVAPSPIRCYNTEKFLCWKRPAKNLFQEAANIMNDEITPISDFRSTEKYRRNAAKELLIRALTILSSGSKNG